MQRVRQLIGQALLPKGYRSVGPGFRLETGGMVQGVELQADPVSSTQERVGFFVNIAVVPMQYVKGRGMLKSVGNADGLWGAVDRLNAMRPGLFPGFGFVVGSEADAERIGSAVSAFLEEHVSTLFEELIGRVRAGNTPFRLW